MKKYFTGFVCLIAILNFSHAQSLVEDLAIGVKGASREFSFTNKQSAFFYGETHSTNTSSWQGFNVTGHEFLDDYEIRVNERKLERSTAINVIVYPDYLKRIYTGGIVEELHPIDSLAAFSVSITSPVPIHVDIIPYFSDGRSLDQYTMQLTSTAAVIARKDHLLRTETENYPVWSAIAGNDFLPQRKEQSHGGDFSPVMMVGRIATSHILVFVVSETASQAESLATNYLSNRKKYDSARRERMETLLRETFVETDDARFNKALAWAKLSLDALIMNQRTKGIFAGLPWFNNYWGRDTFISLPGATLVQGRFSEAKDILKSYAAFQQLDSTSSDYGRIPNIVTTTEKAYNTADGTPRFVMMAKEYVVRSGDTTFAHDIYPTIRRSIKGTLKFHCDSLGFLTHGDAETWMDAVGPNGPWSPRGNRANDIQALWAQQLETGIWFANRFVDPLEALVWQKQLVKLQKSFSSYFVHKGVVADHLNADGSLDKQVRPNQIFTVHLLDEKTRSSVLADVSKHLTYEYGVASLWQGDPDFHPYHQHEPYYPKDAAYHNGTVWTWLQGKVISELCAANEQELASKITQNTVHQILDRGAVGTQSELLDALALPHEKEPRLSGTFSQAWNLAEFIRNFYDDYLGIKVRLLDHHLMLRPKLPRSFGSVKATINLNGRAVPINLTRTGNITRIQIDGKNLRKGGSAEVVLPLQKNRNLRATFHVAPKLETTYLLRKNVATLYVNGIKDKLATTIDSASQSGSRLALARPKLRPNLKALCGPSYPLIDHTDLKNTNPNARIFAHAEDPSGDDTGTGAFVYPFNPYFVKGSFDIREFVVKVDNDFAYFHIRFSALSNPGWHPEYGFQLTYIAIAIDEDGKIGSGKLMVEHNAHYALGERNGYEKLILIGGGVQVEDQNGKILAGYIPVAADGTQPLGDASDGTIDFAVPLRFLGRPSSAWTFTVLTGAQDDHGGAGLGEFRTVNKEAGEWNGGGRLQDSDPNIYDVMVVSPTK